MEVGKMKIWKKPSTWYISERGEHKFHTDIVLEDNEELLVLIRTKDKVQELYRIKNYKRLDSKYTKVHVELSWEHDKDIIC